MEFGVYGLEQQSTPPQGVGSFIYSTILKLEFDRFSDNLLVLEKPLFFWKKRYYKPDILFKYEIHNQIVIH